MCEVDVGSVLDLTLGECFCFFLSDFSFDHSKVRYDQIKVNFS